MRIKNLDLIIAILIVVMNVGWTQVPNRSILVGVILALPLVFILPGYMLIQTLLCERLPVPQFARRFGQGQAQSLRLTRSGQGQARSLRLTDYVLLSLGLSIVLDIVVGFALNLFPFGLQTLSWTLALGLITSVCVLLTALLRQSNVVTTIRIPKIGNISTKILCGLALLVTSAALWLSVIRPPAVQANFTQFWMLPEHTNSCTVSLGVQNFEATSVTYRIVMKTNGAQVQTWSSIVLAPQQEWKQSIALTPSDTRTLALDAQLYRADAPTKVYRDVHMTMDVLKGDKNETLHC